MDLDDTILPAEARTAGLTDQMRGLDRIAGAFGRSLTGALARGVVEGRRFEDVLQSIGATLVQASLRAALKPVETGLAGLFAQGAEGLFKAVSPSRRAACCRAGASGPSPPAGSSRARPISRWPADSASWARPARRRSCRWRADPMAGSACAAVVRVAASPSRSTSRRPMSTASAARKRRSPPLWRAPLRAAVAAPDRPTFPRTRRRP